MRISDWSSDVCSSDLSLGSLDTVDGWRERVVQGRKVSIRAFPPRIVHILAGNAPIVPPITIVRGAITKGVHLMKMPSNDMFTATALLRTMADVGPNHPTTRRSEEHTSELQSLMRTSY